jgi:hypothetical protein
MITVNNEKRFGRKSAKPIAKINMRLIQSIKDVDF